MMLPTDIEKRLADAAGEVAMKMYGKGSMPYRELVDDILIEIRPLIASQQAEIERLRTDRDREYLERQNLVKLFDSLKASFNEGEREIERLRGIVAKLVEALKGSSSDRGLIADYADALNEGIVYLAGIQQAADR